MAPIINRIIDTLTIKLLGEYFLQKQQQLKIRKAPEQRSQEPTSYYILGSLDYSVIKCTITAKSQIKVLKPSRHSV